MPRQLPPGFPDFKADHEEARFIWENDYPTPCLHIRTPPEIKYLPSKTNQVAFTNKIDFH